MNVYLRIDINLLSFILLWIVSVIAYRSLDRKDRLNSIFLKTCYVVLVELAVEAATCIINNRDVQGLIPVSQVLHILLFAVAPLITGLWFIFIYRWLYDAERHTAIGHDTVHAINSGSSRFAGAVPYVIAAPVVLNSLITVLSPFYGFIFTISESNVYHRGNLFPLSMVITYMYIAAGFVLVIINRKKIMKEEFLPLSSFGIMPLIGGVLQAAFYGILLMWSMAAFSLILIFIFLQQRMVQIDKLSGVWTRGSFDCYIERKIKTGGNTGFGIIFIDMDDLKYINDNYGHNEGDAAIRASAGIIRTALPDKDIIARYGGDEFVIVIETEDTLKLDKALRKIRDGFDSYNIKNKTPYKLKYSAGSGIFKPDRHKLDQFLHYVDDLMYADKRSKV